MTVNGHFLAVICVLCGFNMNSNADLRFTESGNSYTFDTGELRGTLRKDGRSYGLSPVVDVKSGVQIAAHLGLLTPYRLLDADKRYLPDAREWKSDAHLLEDGRVQVNWVADDNHPFDLQIVYQWASAKALDAVVTVTAKTTLPQFEVFMTCYFNKFDLCHGSGAEGFVQADRKWGHWLCFPRDDAARKIMADGRWTHAPNAVDFIPVENYRYPLGVRASLDSGLTAVMMSRPSECFAVSMPYQKDTHYSLYCSLFGYDIEAGKSCTAQCRLVIGANLSEKEVIEIYREFEGKE